MTTIALTGATGYVGRFVVTELQQRGMHIRALSRPTGNRSGFTHPIEWVRGDLRSQEAVESLVTGADALVHLAYEHVPGKYRNGEGDNLPAWLDANVGGSIRLFKAAGQAGIKRFIFLSSRAVFSRTEAGRVLDEDHPPSPDTHYGAYKLTVEDFLADFARTSEMQVCSIRATGVYGLTYPVDRSKWWDIVQAVLSDQPVTSNRGGTEVHGVDVARAIGVLLARPTLDINLLHLSDLYVTNRDLVRLIRRFTGKEGELPPPAPPPSNVLVSRHLADLGIQLGGEALLEETVRQLVEIAVRQSSPR